MNLFAPLFLVLAFGLIELLIGGTRVLLTLPACGLVALVSVRALFAGSWRNVAVPVGALLSALLLIGYLALRQWCSPVEYLARLDFFSLLGAAMMYLLVALVLVRSQERRLLVLGLLILGVGQVVLGAVQFRLGNQWMPFAWLQRPDHWWRASGTYISPNHYAGLMEVLALMALSFAFWSHRSWMEKILVAYAGLCCGAGVALSGSRGGYVSLAFGLICLLAMSLGACRVFYRRTWWLVSWGALAGVTLAGGAALTLVLQSEGLSQRMAEIVEPQNMRLMLWKAAVAQFHLNPVWGTGAGTYLYYGRQFRDWHVQLDPIHVHNDYIHLLAEYGAVGAGLFALFLLWHVGGGLRAIGPLARKARQAYETRSDALALHLGALSAIGALVVHSALDFNLHVPANALLMALMFGIVANPGLSSAPGAIQRASAILGRVSLGALALIVLALGMPLLPGEWYFEAARAALNQGRLEDARSAAATALGFERSNPNLYYVAGEAAREMGARKMGDARALSEEAVARFQAALELFPEDSRALVKLGQSYDQLRRFDEAEDAYEKAMEIDPLSAHVRAFHAVHLFTEGSILEAATEFDLVLEMDYGSANSFILPLRERVRQMLLPMSKIPVPPDVEILPETPEPAPAQ